MAPLFFILALVIQGSFIYATTDDEVENTDNLQAPVEQDAPTSTDAPDEVVKDYHAANRDFMDLFFLSSNPMFTPFPMSSATMMSQATSSNQTYEEQLANIKQVTEDITKLIQNEMANMMAVAIALNSTDQNEEHRQKRSVETPMDSTRLIMRLLNHIKSNNEYQNIAIEKMMSAQEIADKFGIEFNPDPEILTDLAVASNNHASELTSMLKDVCDVTNTTQKTESAPTAKQAIPNDTYYVYNRHPEEAIPETNIPAFEFQPEILPRSQHASHVHSGHGPHCHNNHERQIPPPPVQHHSPVSPRPNFYDPFPYTSDVFVDVSPAIFIPIEDPEPEPEIVGEEIEETISTKLFVERGDEPGASTVNQVTTYTVAERSHFRSPQIQKLPEQVQYCFYLF